MSLLEKASLILTPNAVKEGKAYSIIPSNGNGDMTATRATTATLTNELGYIEDSPYNLVKYSEDFSNTSWSKFNATVISNTIISPNGTLTADLVARTSTTLVSNVFQDFTLGSSDMYTATIYAKLGTVSTNFGLRIQGSYPNRGDALFNLSTGVLVGVSNGGTNTLTSGTITNVGNGWYKLTITTKFSSNLATIRHIFGATSLTSINAWEAADGALSNAYIWGAQLVQGSLPRDYFYTTDRLNVPRLNYDVAGGCPSILLEPQRTNIFLNSSNAITWDKISTIITPNAINAPNNVLEGSLVTAQPLTTTAHLFYRNITFNLSIYTFGCFFKKANTDLVQINMGSQFGNCYANFNLTSGTVVKVIGCTAGVQSFSNGWYYCYIVSPTPTLAGAQSFIFALIDSPLANQNPQFTSAGESVYAWGAQLEQGAYPTSYIPTIASTVTRNADILSKSNIYTNGYITSAGGTWFVELNNNFSLIRDIASRGISISDNITNFSGNAFYIRNGSTTSQRLTITKYIEGVSSVFYLTTTDTVKIAIKWNGATADIFVNGVKVISATAFTTTNMEFLNGGGQDVPKYIKSTMLFPTPLTDTECINLTTL